MKRFIITMVVLGATVATNSALAGKLPKDPTKYDCRVTVRIERYHQPGSKVPGVRFVKECPHKDKMAAGQCETHWLFGMRCKS
ncbi:MAG: hypothetical protein PCFJNLEI_01151 [Verrucomicrobiae bacterium]|nr:hypothetical protein [Verrucomicrobiae bacterium]